MSGYGGERALMALPPDSRLHVQLSRYFYDSTIKRVRNNLESNRSGLAVIEVATPADAPVLEIVLDRRSLYLFAVRRRGAAEWWGFIKDGCPAILPGGAVQPVKESNSYATLGLPDSINMTPSDLLGGLAGFRGTVNTEVARCLVLLLFLVPEALRFDNLLLEGARYLSAGTQFANTIYPARHRGTVTNWAKAIPSDRNVLLPHLP